MQKLKRGLATWAGLTVAGTVLLSVGDWLLTGSAQKKYKFTDDDLLAAPSIAALTAVPLVSYELCAQVLDRTPMGRPAVKLVTTGILAGGLFTGWAVYIDGPLEDQFGPEAKLADIALMLMGVMAISGTAMLVPAGAYALVRSRP